MERRETIAAFAKAYLRRLGDDEIAAAAPDDLYGLVLSTFGFVDGRRLQPWVVRVFYPDAETDGFTSPGSILETNVDDSPFLVDSVTEELSARSLVVRRILHPVMGTSRDEEGRLERISSARDASHRESVMHFEIDRRLTDATQADLEERVKTILRDVRLVVRDFEPMQDRAHSMLEMAAPCRGALLPARGRRDGRLPRLAPAAELRLLRVIASTNWTTRRRAGRSARSRKWSRDPRGCGSLDLRRHDTAGFARPRAATTQYAFFFVGGTSFSYRIASSQPGVERIQQRRIGDVERLASREDPEATSGIARIAGPPACRPVRTRDNPRRRKFSCRSQSRKSTVSPTSLGE